MTNFAIPKFRLPDPEIRGTGTFSAPPLADGERAVIHARALELEKSADPVLQQVGLDNCRLLAEIDRLSQRSEVGGQKSEVAAAGCGTVTT